MTYAKFVSKSSLIVLTGTLCTTLAATDVSAQRRGGGGGPSRGGAGRVEGRAVPRGSVPRGGVAVPRGGSPRVFVRSPYRSSYYYRPGFSLGFYGGYGYPFYGFPYGYYGYPYRYYGYPYSYSGYGYYGYPGYAYSGYGYGLPPAGYDYGGVGYGGVRIQGAPPDAQVFADGYYVGIVDDFDGVFQHLNLQAGPHNIEIRIPGAPPIGFDVNVQPGRTLTLHAR